MKQPIFAHIKSPGYTNHGDTASVPANYFPEWQHCEVVGLDDVIKFPRSTPVILGGGGILAFPDYIARTAQSRPTIIFGAGLNNPLPFDPQPVREALNVCALVAIRDRRFAGKFGFDYVPCASAAHPEFRARKFPLVDVLKYQHAWADPIPGDYPALSNMDRRISSYDAIAQITNSRTVITNSFHGAYWSQLAGRRVILWRATDLRFFSGLPAPATIVNTEAELQTALDYLPDPIDNAVYNDYVSRVEHFRQRVNNYLEKL